MGVLGRVFSYEEFSIFDGDGIRTTVFLKGCPLRCEWCHSPEGQSTDGEYLRTPNGCLHCGRCERAAQIIDGKLCYTAQSVAVCPNQCIRYCGEAVDSEAVVAKLEKNLPLLNQSGGGVTFSGGEPLYQIDFLVDCLSRLQGKTHRMIQTSGFAPAEAFGRVLPHLEGALYDLKIFDREVHRRYTGVPNDLILQNYRTLAASRLPFTTRIPLIPTVTDTEENLHAICRFMRECGVFYAELMPYHSMTGSKYPLCGKTYAPSFDDTQAPQIHHEIFADHGIQIKVL